MGRRPLGRRGGRNGEGNMVCNLLLAAFCCLAVIQDLTTRKIKNGFNVAAALIGLCCALATKETSVLDALLGFGLAFVSGLVLWKLGAIRGGDAKFFWCIGVIRGWKRFGIILLCALLAGGVTALALLLFKRDGKQRFSRLWNYLKCTFLSKSYKRYEAENPREFPFSIPLAIGCLAEWILRLQVSG